jgi:hypothetical protein
MVCWFHDKSTNVVFMLLVFVIVSLFTVKIEKFNFKKRLNVAIF